MQFQDLLDLFQSFGLNGLAFVAVILILVFAGRKAGLLANGNHARAANIILSAILFGLADNPDAEKGLMAALASILSALAFELLKYLGGMIKPAGGPRPPM